MAGQKNFITELEDLVFQIEMLSGVAFVLWESLVKPEVCEENYTRSFAAYLLYDQTEKFIKSFRTCLEKFDQQNKQEE